MSIIPQALRALHCRGRALIALALALVAFNSSLLAQEQFDSERLPIASPVAIPAPSQNLEERLRDLEQQLYLQQRQYEALSQELYTADEKKDGKKDEKKDDKKKPDEGYVVGSDLGMSAAWKDGLEFSSKNKDFRIHIGGRTQFDTGWFSVDPNLYNANGTPTAGLGNVYGDGVDFRRARLRVDGSMYETIEFAVEYDFMNSARIRGQRPSVTQPLAAPQAVGTVLPPPPATPDLSTFTDIAVTAPTDLWWQFKELPVIGNLRIGNQKEAIGFEHLVSSRFLPFMERSYNQDAFYGGVFNGFVPGIQAFDTVGEDELASWSLGVYKPTNSVFAINTGDGDYSAVGRLTKALWYKDGGRNVLHVGASGRQATAYGQAGNFYADPTVPASIGQGRLVQFRTRDAIRTGLSAQWPTPANITLFGEEMQTVNGELAAVYGRFTLQAEYLVNYLHDARLEVNDPRGNTAIYHGGYVQMMYFLTDDHDNYDKKRAAFDRLRPTQNAFLVKDVCNGTLFNKGAWQVGARYNYLNLNDGLPAGGVVPLNGGILHNMTFGVNWFLNPNMKIQSNYMATYRNAPLPGTTGDGWIHGWGMRLAHDF